MSEAADFPLPPATFEFLVLSLRTQVEMQLGLLHFGEDKDQPAPDLRLARHGIDVLAMLLEKTQGNLSLDEKRLLENSLTELRFRFVQVSDQIAKKTPDAEPPGPLRITVLGSGTSVGVPTIGCQCEVCRSSDPRDQRLRPSILVRWQDHSVLIDTTPDFRAQALRARLDRLDAILFTHAHADHIMGLDDVRPFNYRQSGPIPIYGSADTLNAIRRTFAYIFDQRAHDSHVPRIEARTIDAAPVRIHDLDFLPVPVRHGSGLVLGFRFGGAAYLTDHSEIPEESLALLENLDVLFLDALRYKPHPTHSTVQKSLAYVERLQPRRTFFTHICHDLGHQRAESLLPPHVRLAYDGLEIEVPPALTRSAAPA